MSPLNRSVSISSPYLFLLSPPPPPMTSPSSTSSAHDEVQRHDEMPLMESEEASEVLQELRRMEDEDPDGFYDYKVGADGRLEGIFWASSALGWDYVTNGGGVVVDTTFRTNRCGAPFVPFLGLNHHRRPIVFGCGVVADQSIDSFVWLLRAFMQSIQDDVPKSIITDGGDAVVAAVKAVFPQSNHRVCTSHVEQAIREHLLHGSAQDDFRSLMRDACSPAAFDERWSGFLAKHRTAENEGWLATMHRRRELWAAAFTCHKFFLGMASDQRTECLATGLHTGLADDMSLLDLFWHTDDWTYRMRDDGAELDLAVSMSRLPLTTKHRYLEANAARRFTPANFYLLREEIEKMDGFVAVDTLPTISSPDEKIYLLDSKQERCGGGAPFVVQWCTNRPGVDGKLAVTLGSHSTHDAVIFTSPPYP
ncbi:hypothetical protein E2562_013243 [Oryza meyeriana var. granulata]|uniref:Protein FAR1-RELATED SEQUENCE n=1 Tax=Oryza meyeriana var. granulata TaxID=110450 RepID=A0A6G1D2D1_9ORYZ|nr:hypothetical protein E2562_013243 [Oryza meyeriana var. granulata]